MKIRNAVFGTSRSKTLLKTIFPILAIAAGCSGGTITSGDLERGDDFVAIPRTLSSTVTAQRVVGTNAVPTPGANESFFVAINKKQLGQRYFLSAYMKQAYPGTVGAGAASSLGTLVVTFRVQNGKLFVFDAQDGRASSDTFDPSLVVEAYPVVETYAPFLGLPGNDKYVLFDPAAGLNRFGVLSDAYAQGSQPIHFQVDLSFLQNFRTIADGTTFEQVFSGAVNDTLAGNPQAGGNQYKASGTLGIALRRYTEGAGFQPFDAAQLDQDYFFRNDPLIVKNTGGQSQTAAHWNIKKGMKPIKWLISDQFVAVAAANPKYDIMGAVKAGIENWNSVFGFKALEAVVAKPTDSYADDDNNYLIYDADPTYGYAFANWRVNPNSGEIRGASVYFNAIWLSGAIDEFDPSTTARPTAKPIARPAIKQLTWGDIRPQTLCTLWAQSFRDLSAVEAAPAPGGPAAALTPKQMVENMITHVIVHEVGHTLGLRHNFKGSLYTLPQNSSVMEYIQDADAVAAGRNMPGPYDVDAIKYLYGLATTPPAQSFCTDDSVVTDPYCQTFDRTEDPLIKYWGRSYNILLGRILNGQDTTGLWQYYIDAVYFTGTANFLRAADPTDQARAWIQLDAPLKVGFDNSANETKYPGYSQRVSDFQNYLLKKLYLDDPSTRGQGLDNDPVLAPAMLTTVTTELAGILTNSDKIRGYDLRRTTVDVLKKMQVQRAYETLLSSRATIATARAGMAAGSSDAALTDDLLARIDVATHPYFK
ncbi:MAG: hypothetical protein JWN44_5732 [Myxococcales bacterium]|nr:hypothetical protein [Myxococcales bacterium]